MNIHNESISTYQCQYNSSKDFLRTVVPYLFIFHANSLVHYLARGYLWSRFLYNLHLHSKLSLLLCQISMVFLTWSHNTILQNIVKIHSELSLSHLTITIHLQQMYLMKSFICSKLPAKAI